MNVYPNDGPDEAAKRLPKTFILLFQRTVMVKTITKSNHTLSKNIQRLD